MSAGKLLIRERYEKQAEELVRSFESNGAEAIERLKRHHPRFHRLPVGEPAPAAISLGDAQLVIAREHGFESWPKLAKYIQTIHLIESGSLLDDPVTAFLEMASVPRHAGHASGTLEHAEMILARYPQVAASNIYTAAVLADEARVQGLLLRDPGRATAKGGPHDWDALTYLCFSRYLRLDSARSDAFVQTARLLLDAGASANTGWYEMIDYPTPRPTFESVIYGAAGVARHAELTKLLLEHGADPNDEETPYHVPEGYDNTVLRIILETERFNTASLTTVLVRKADWHDEEGLRLTLEYGGDPNAAIHHAIRRDNRPAMVELLLDHGADPNVRNPRDGRSAMAIAAQRGRGDLLALFKARGFVEGFNGIDRLLAACARNDGQTINTIASNEPQLLKEVVTAGGTPLAEFAGNGNVDGLRCLLDVGVSANALYQSGDGYFDIAEGSTALHVAAWRAWPEAVKELIARGAPVNALDKKGRTALALAVKACVDSYWTDRRSPDSVAALLQAGASMTGVQFPCGYEEVDKLLRKHANS